MSKRSYKHIILAKAAISLFFIYILYNKFLQASSFDLLRHIDPGAILICLGLTFLSIVFKSLRWKSMIEMMGGRIGFTRLVKLYIIGFYYGSISPGRAGEFIKGSRLSENGLDTRSGLISILYERFFDIATPVAIVAIYLSFNALLHNEAHPISLLFGSFSISIVLWAAMVYLFQLLKDRIQLLRDVAVIESQAIFRHALLPATSSILNWTCVCLTACVLLGTLNVNISISRIIFAVCIAMLSILLPFSLNGWGIREAAYVWALSPFSEPSVSILFSVAFTLIGTYTLALVGFMLELCARERKSI